MKNVILAFFLSVFLALNLSVYSQKKFIHPGCINSQADFDRVKRMINPMDPLYNDTIKAGWDILCASKWANQAYAWTPGSVIRGSGTPQNVVHAERAANCAYQNALRWKIAGDIDAANRAVETLNGWSYYCWGGIGGTTDLSLAAGLQGYQFANAAELMRDYPGWSEKDKVQYKKWLLYMWYPVCVDFLRRRHDTWGRGKPGHYWSNWGLCNTLAVMSIGVFCDDVYIYNEGMSFFRDDKVGNFGSVRHGDGYTCESGWAANDGLNEYLGNLVPDVYPDKRGPYGVLGQMQESGRDQGHTMMALGLALDIAKTGWNQGDDLFAHLNNRLAAGTEWVAAYNSGVDSLPWTRYGYASVHTPAEYWIQCGPNSNDRGSGRNIWHRAVGHYEGIKGVPMPYSRSRLGVTDWGCGTGGASWEYDHLGFTTLMDYRPGGLAPKDSIPVSLSAMITYDGKTNSTSHVEYVKPGASVTLRPMLPLGVRGGTWRWDNGATTQSITVNPTSSTFVRVTYTSSTGAKSVQAFSIVVVGDCEDDRITPRMASGSQVVNDTVLTILPYSRVSLAAFTVMGKGAWLWQNGATSPTVELDNIGKDTDFRINYTNQCGKIQTVTFHIKVKQIAGIRIPEERYQPEQYFAGRSASVTSGSSYYIYNVATGLFLSQGADYTTRSTVSFNDPRSYKLTGAGSSYSFYVNNSDRSGRYVYLDASSHAWGDKATSAGFTLSAAENGQFRISSGSATASLAPISDIDRRINQLADTVSLNRNLWTFWPVAGNDNAIKFINAEKCLYKWIRNSYIRLISDSTNTALKEAYDDAVAVFDSNTATLDNVYKTLDNLRSNVLGCSFILNPNFEGISGNECLSEWSCPQTFTDAPVPDVTNTASGIVELYHQIRNVSQTITHLPAGKYRISTHGFYSEGSGQAYFYVASNGVLQKVALPQLGTMGVLSEAGNAFQDAQATFAAGGYESVMYLSLTEPADVVVGVDCKTSDMWVPFGRFNIQCVNAVIEPTSSQLLFTENELSKPFSVTGLTSGDITLSVKHNSVSLNKTTITKAEVQTGVTITATYDPAKIGTVTDTIVVNSAADNVSTLIIVRTSRDSECSVDGNLITDPSLAQAAIPGWGNRQRTEETAYCGATSGRVSGVRAGSIAFPVIWTPNTTYVVKAWVNTNNTGFVFGLGNAYVNNVTSSEEALPNTNGEWKQVSKLFTTGSSATTGEIWFNNYTANTEGVGYIDKWELQVYKDAQLPSERYQPEQYFTAQANTINSGNSYYIYNKATGLFLSQGASWGTRSIVSFDDPRTYKLTGTSPSYSFFLNKTNFGGNYLFLDATTYPKVYTDGGTASNWTLTESLTGVYKLSSLNYTANAGFLAPTSLTDRNVNYIDDASASDRNTWTFWPVAGNDNAVTFMKAEKALYKAIKEAFELVAINPDNQELKSKYDVAVQTYTSNTASLPEVYSALDNLRVVLGGRFILNPKLAGTTKKSSLYEWDYPISGRTDADGMLPDVSNAMSGSVEMYRQIRKVSQTIVHLPAGEYTLTGHGFYRDGGGLAYLFAQANGQTVETKLPLLGSDGVLTDGGTDFQDAAVTFAEGRYKVSLSLKLTAPADVTLGVDCRAADMWVAFGPFELVSTYTSAVNSTETDYLHVYGADKSIKIHTASPVEVSIYSLTGVMLHKSMVDSYQSIRVIPGVYLVKAGSKVVKAIVE